MSTDSASRGPCAVVELVLKTQNVLGNWTNRGLDNLRNSLVDGNKDFGIGLLCERVKLCGVTCEIDQV